MKIIIILFSIVLFSATTTFAQWGVDVDWDATSSNCNCDASAGSKFIIYLNIKDVANNNFDEDYAKVVDADEFSYTFYNEIKDDLQEHCAELNNTYYPNYTLSAYVVFWCAETTPPTLLCDGYGTTTGATCIDFNQANQSVTGIILD